MSNTTDTNPHQAFAALVDLLNDNGYMVQAADFDTDVERGPLGMFETTLRIIAVDEDDDA